MRRVSSERRRRTTTSSTNADDDAHRPLQLHGRSHSLSSLYPATPISSYYALNLSILHAFDSLYTNRQYEVAYAMGLQFIETALLEIPKHGYFFSPKHAKEREESSREAERVCKLLEDMVGEERAAEKARLEKLAQLARDQRLATYRPALSTSSAVALDHLDDSSVWSEFTICSDTIANYLCPMIHAAAEQPNKQQRESLKLPVKELRLERKEEKEPTVTSTPTTSIDRSLIFEPTIPDQPRVDDEDASHLLLQQREPAPSVDSSSSKAAADYFYQESLSASESADLERALFLSGLDVRPVVTDTSLYALPPSQQQEQRQRPPTKGSSDIDIATLRACYHEDFDSLRTRGRVRISRVATHQGRLADTINGCTVIAPLLCIHHFQNDKYDNVPDPGLPDAVIEYVIDKETSGLLPEVRDKLGLTKDALIIPSDVHDFLLDRGLLMQEQFVTVCGGNILDDAHVNEMMNAILYVPDKFAGKRIAATVFFHEHVIAILKLDRGDGRLWFDLLDSLPFEDTLHARPFNSETSMVESSSWIDDDYVPYAARIRCLDDEALRATLRWYACSKFNEQDCAYIDSYAWDDSSHDFTDFDPRVFQAFVWAEA